MATYKQLLAEREKIEAQIAEVRASEIASAIGQIRALMSEYELTVEDLAPKRGRGRPAAGVKAVAAPRSEIPPKYQDPKTGATWSGRGRAPAWLGKNRDRFLIPAA
ncbi:H-NS family nucleoid-associated regulatory protein [Cupriavidus sp. UME77]|uniref:H-NS histone family protein n=1 Tax=Cupriavidus sp. UME77 TaxID=1862321 RepID=UPI0016048B85|nr:H-NS histone family protein [Cupriavidus sp. UME77]MBB1634937.1 DNA-binding protein [Cupriavidus sp. UME77]